MKSTKSTSIRSLTRCLATIIKEGFTENFVMTNEGAFSDGNGRDYKDGETKILSRLFFGNNNYNESGSVIYVIETNDGTKGTCIKIAGNNK